MGALLELAPTHRGYRLDLLRGALDAWLHPPVPSRIPAIAALAGGGLWTVAAAGVMTQPAPPDWPGYLLDVIPVAIAAVACLLIAVIGLAMRTADAGTRSTGSTIALALVGYLGWIAALLATATGVADGPTLGATQAIAMLGTIAVGIVLFQVGDEVVGTLVVVAAVALLVPWSVMWLAFAATWTAIGLVLLVERSRRLEAGDRPA
jgi:hypothetical protein